MHSVVLIAFQRPGGAEVIEVAPAPLLLTVVIASHGEREGPACELRRARPAHIQPVIEAVEVDDAARRGRRILRHDGNCQKLLDLPASAVDGKAQAVRGRESVLKGRAELALHDVFAGIEQQHGRIDLARVLLHLRAVEPGRVLRRLPHRVQDEGEARIVAESKLQLGIPQVLFGRTVVAVAAGLEVGSAADVIERARLAAELESGAADSVAPGRAALRERGLGRTVLGEDLDHPARSIPVERREGSPHYLDPLRRTQIEVGGLPLAVGGGGGDPVRVKAHAANAELRMRTEPARGNLQVLRIVLPVLDDHAGHSRQALRQIDHRFALADGIGVDAVDRDRQFEAVAL